MGPVTSSDISISELDIACELAAAKAAVYKLQEQIELVYQRRHANIQQTSTVSAFAIQIDFLLTLATSKQRTKLRKAISVDHKSCRS